MARILCLETSYSTCSVAIRVESNIYSLESDKPHSHSESITGLISTCMKHAGLEFKDLDAIAISDGPGSYTGLRIGASTAKGICFGSGMPLIAVSTLEALANAVYSEFPSHLGFVWPMIDARRMEVYHALYSNDLKLHSDISSGIVTDPDFMIALADKQTLLCGDGAVKAEAVLGLKRIRLVQHAKHICALAENSFTNKAFVDLQTYQPFYLKQANITSSVNK